MGRSTRTIQSQLTLGFTAIFVAVLFVICVALLVVLDHHVRAQFDDTLRSNATLICDLMERDTANGYIPTPLAQSLKLPGLYFQLRRPDGSVVATSTSLAGQTLPWAESAGGAHGNEGVFETLTGAAVPNWPDGPHALRMLTWKIASTPNAMVLQLAKSPASLESLQAKLRYWVVGIALLGILVGVILARWIARRTLVPLTHMATTAEQLRVEDLSLRFDENVGTDEVKTVLVSLNRMLDRLTLSFGAHERFIADVAHELKTPLTLLLSEAQVLAQSERSPEEYERFLATVQDEVRAMGQVVESLLMLARAEGGLQVSMSDAPVNEFVMTAVERTAHIAERAEVSIVPTLAMPAAGHDALFVHGDHALLTLAVTNLLRNAIRFAPPQSQVGVIVDVAGDSVVIHVRDSGPGIPAEHLPCVFDRFYRVQDDHSTFQGTGLGLAIVKGVVDLHRGRIEVVNLAEGGCQFTLELKTGIDPPLD